MWLENCLTVHWEWRCSIENLTGLLYRREKVIAIQLLLTIVTGSYTIFREENWFCPYGKHCECTVFIGMLLSIHLFFKDSWDNCLNCPVSARIISSFSFKHRTSYHIFFSLNFVSCFNKHIFFKIKAVFKVFSTQWKPAWFRNSRHFHNAL